MSTKRELLKLTTKTYRECENMQHVPIKEFKNKDQLLKLVDQQNELKDKFRFYKRLARHIKEDKNENIKKI